jgi:peptidoglycan glycosyltransferase
MFRLGHDTQSHTLDVEGSGHHHQGGVLMEKRIRRLGIFMLVCFVALFIQLNNIQVLKANSLATSPSNPRVQLLARSQTRGSIFAADGTVLATSVLAPKGSLYKYQRVYPPNTASLFAQIVGFDSSVYGNFRGIEAEYNSYLVPHTPPARNLRDLLTNRTEVDNVTLTVNENLQLQVASTLDEFAPGVKGAAAVVYNPTTGAIEAMYSNPSFNPNPLVSPDTKTQNFAWKAYLAESGNPLVAGTYDQTYPPGSSFKVVTTSAVLQGRPDLAAMTYPEVTHVTLPNTGNPPQVLTNYHSTPCGGDLETLLIMSCDADFASIGQQLGAQALVTQAQAYGFNQQIPLDVPSDTVASSNFGTVASFADDVPGLMKSAIGQESVTASALQMALVAGTVANGGVEMTPHLMEQIRDSQGDLVETYKPKAWMQPISPQTAATLTTFMQGVVKSGTAAPSASFSGFNPSWDVAAKTGTAQTGSFGPNPQFTDDWMIAFAPAGNTKVAIAVVLPQEPGSATGAAYSGPIVRQILGDVLGEQP